MPPALHPLHLHLRRVMAQALLLSSGGALAACNEADHALPAPIDTHGFALPSCAWAEDVTPASPVDYLAVHEIGPQFASPISVDSSGSPCETASDFAACSAQLEPTEGGDVAKAWSDLPSRLSYPNPQAVVTTTRGDSVGLADDHATLMALLGSVDTAAEAALVARVDGYTISCSDPETGGVRDEADGFSLLATKETSFCPVEVYRYVLRVKADGTLSETERALFHSSQGCVGRRPEGLEPAAVAHRAPALGAFFAQIAHLEAAAVHAFAVLVRELEALDAPTVLVTEARAAIADEVRHAATMGRLALRFGGALSKVEVAERPLRSLYALALDNAVEGCVRETWGALFGAYQARRAQHPEVRAAMAAIARDEARHAALSWQIDAWARAQLSGSERAALTAAQDAAVLALSEDRGDDGDALLTLAGVPSRSERARLLAVLRAELWSPAAHAA